VREWSLLNWGLISGLWFFSFHNKTDYMKNLSAW
jgi:hypothetical protein